MNSVAYARSELDAELRRARSLLEELTAADQSPSHELAAEIRTAKRQVDAHLSVQCDTDSLLERARAAGHLAARLAAWRQHQREVHAFEPQSSGARRRIAARLEPLSGIVCNEEAEPYPWRAIDNDPQFRVHGLDQFRGNWVELTFVLQSPWSSGTPRLYLDFGQGFSEELGCRVPPPERADEFAVLFFVSPTLRVARLDPFAHAGPFQLHAVTLRKVSRPRAAAAMLAKVRASGRLREVFHFRSLRSASPRAIRRRLLESYNQVVQGSTYSDWIQRYEPSESVRARLVHLREQWKQQPLISVVVPVYNPPEDLLRAAIDSVIEQSYPRWQLCIANDASTNPEIRPILDAYVARDSRIKVVHRVTNGHISAATNSALELAEGEFVAFLDHDDRLHPDALHHVAQAIVESPDVALLYSDEDKLDQAGRRYGPYFKSEFNHQLLLSHNMICHLACYRRDLLTRLGGLRSEFDGSQDYDLALRAVELVSREQIVHIPRVLYHWTASLGSTAISGEEKPYAHIAAMRAIRAHLERIGVSAEVMEAPESKYMNRVKYDIPSGQPSVCIVIPTRDRVDLLAMCLESIRDKTTYRNYSICVVDNGSVDSSTLKYLKRVSAAGVQVIRDASPFNFSALNNNAVAATRSEYVVLMNNDIEIVTPDWIEEMLGHAVQPNAGAVGARLWYPDGRLQHGGVVLGIGGVAGHSHRGLERGSSGYFSRAVLQQEFSAVTAACLMVRRSIYDEVGGLDPVFGVAFNDVDFCLRVMERGYRNLWTPYAEMIHHESASRGLETTPEKRARFRNETKLMQSRWGASLRQDPAYSPNLTLEAEDFNAAWPPRLDPYEFWRPTPIRQEGAS